jgi:integrase
MTTENPKLEPIVPKEAVRLWKESRIDEVAKATLELQGFHVEEFVEWLSAEGMEDIREVSARTVHEFRLGIKSELAQNTVAQRVGTVARFLRFCVSIDAVDPSVPERIEVPNRRGEPRTETLEPEQAEDALSYLRQFAYASKLHALLALTWHTGLRTGTLRTLDTKDVEEEKNRIRVRHRLETETPLKNGKTAERYVALSVGVTEVLADYVEYQRPDIEDEYGRDPLFATIKGRASVNTLRRWFQTATRPCLYTDCPHGEDPDDCRASSSTRFAKECPSSVSGHPIRRGAITRFLRDDVPEKAISDRCNVSQSVLDEHYNVRSEDEKAEQRREYFDGM